MKLPEYLNIHLKTSFKNWLISSPSAKSCQDSAHFHFLVICHKMPCKCSSAESSHQTQKPHQQHQNTKFVCLCPQHYGDRRNYCFITPSYQKCFCGIMSMFTTNNQHCFTGVYIWFAFTINEPLRNHLPLAPRPIPGRGCPALPVQLCPAELRSPYRTSRTTAFWSGCHC